MEAVAPMPPAPMATDEGSPAALAGTPGGAARVSAAPAMGGVAAMVATGQSEPATTSLTTLDIGALFKQTLAAL